MKNKLGKIFSIIIVLIGVLLFSVAVLPTKRVIDEISLNLPGNLVGSITVQLEKPTIVASGKDETILLRVLPNKLFANALFITRADLNRSTTPEGEVQEVAGTDGAAVFFWKIKTDTAQKGTNRIWLYLRVDGKAVLLGAFPVELPISTVPWGGQIVFAIGVISIGAFLLNRLRV